MVNVKDLSDSAEKLERRGRGAGQDYSSGVENVSDSEQQDATLAAADTWEQALQDAIAEGRFSSGVSSPNKSWQDAALETGANRFTEGIGQAGDTWRAGFDEFASVLESLQLDPRGPRGSAENQQRSIQVQEALHNARSE